MSLDRQVSVIVAADFSIKEQGVVYKQLTSLTLDHVMARSEINLLNTKLSILKLAKGNLEELIHLVQCAKTDFRDVIYWASQEEKSAEIKK